MYETVEKNEHICLHLYMFIVYIFTPRLFPLVGRIYNLASNRMRYTCNFERYLKIRKTYFCNALEKLLLPDFQIR